MPMTLADYEQAAARALDPGTQAYYFGGAADEITLRDNVAAWQRLAIRPRVLVGVGRRDLSVTVLGRPRPHPLLVAPMALHGLADPDGEIATARAARAAAAVTCVSTFATKSMEDVAQAVPDCARWYQLYVFNDRGVSRELVARAEENGYEALVVTVDLPMRGVRERELRNPVGSGASNAPASMTAQEFDRLLDSTLTWEDIGRFASETELPVLIKGVLRPDDALLAAQHGAAGVIVSNHGGRQLDTVLAGADALPAVVEAVGDRIDVLVDGGIRRGTDVLKALALGARAVMIGRPVLWGLAAEGADGARKVLEILLTELDCALALAGAPRASELESSFIQRGPWA